ncbi:MAG: ATP-dependent helicase [Candidatus Eremiobacteraeota bacterium]|nr:ATP-dependent helicase [Candidatus Eremiobacteraeota bacterium]
MSVLPADRRAAEDAPFEALFFITGTAGSGKTDALASRAERAIERFGRDRVVVAAGSRASARILSTRLGETPLQVSALHDVACAFLREHAARLSFPRIDLIDEIDAAARFERLAEPLLNMEWTEILEAQLDPEVPGMRAPERFLEAAFRLIGKLRDAQIAPDAFLETSRRGAMHFYAKPPNLAHYDLLAYTKDSYRDSLAVDQAELERQFRREIDLAKILHKLYSAYLEGARSLGAFTAADVVAEATALLKSDGALAARARESRAVLLVDDAQELTLGALFFLEALYGPELNGVTLCGDAQSALGTFSGARPDRVFAVRGASVKLDGRGRVPQAIEAAARRLLGEPGDAALAQANGITLFRAPNRSAEASFIAEHVAALLKAGARPREVAVVLRSVQHARIYEDAMLNRGIDVEVAGDLNLFTVPDVCDALALLWNVYDPFRHEWLLRTLSGRWLGLSDASLATLCAEPDTGQTTLFTELEEELEHSGSWDRMRDVRLGWNVVRGDQDARLSDFARARVSEFRATRARWVELCATASLRGLATRVFADGLAAAGAPGSARARSQLRYLQRLLARIEAFAKERPAATLGDFLAYAESRAVSDFESCEPEGDDDAVRLFSLDAVRGHAFEHVTIAGAQAGSFPRYYVPDAFLFSPSLGMIAKENVGEARAARTAKFTYYMYRTKTRDAYNREERRAFAYAMRRATRTLLVTAGERATRGVAAPEFLNELQKAGLAGARNLS